eukprot:6464502-Amphidinium_carterae.2
MDGYKAALAILGKTMEGQLHEEAQLLLTKAYTTKASAVIIDCCIEGKDSMKNIVVQETRALRNSTGKKEHELLHGLVVDAMQKALRGEVPK